MLRNKKILLGVCGSIAAYKSAFLVRLLIKSGADVRVIMTPSAHGFITPLTLSTLSQNKVLTEFSSGSEGQWNNHVELGLWADLFIIAPATASTLAKMATGNSDNLLIATYLSARCPVMVAPAMDLDMYLHPASQSAISSIKNYGNIIIDAEHGELASGLVGTGRMAEPEHILEKVNTYFNNQDSSNTLAGKKVLITAGPTYEAIDPVRFIGNHSSGKMGFELAKNAQNKGAIVTLVIGPNNLNIPDNNITVVNVSSAEEMGNACLDIHAEQDIIILSAAVADYTPLVKATQKIKKKDGEMTIALKKTIDIARTLGEKKTKGQVLVGFALETENELTNAKNKLKNKNLDIIVLNSLNDSGAGFKKDTNKITLIAQNSDIKEFNLKSKQDVAQDIVTEIINYIES